jgi:hypothetical protein
MRRRLLKQTKNPTPAGLQVWNPFHLEIEEHQLTSYANAYWRAAQELAGEHAAGGEWALPVVFLSRHAIEVLVKAVLLAPHDRRTEVCPHCVLNRSHNLREQVEDLKRIAHVYGTSVSTKLIDLLEAFDDADPNGM